MSEVAPTPHTRNTGRTMVVCGLICVQRRDVMGAEMVEWRVVVGMGCSVANRCDECSCEDGVCTEQEEWIENGKKEKKERRKPLFVHRDESSERGLIVSSH